MIGKLVLFLAILAIAVAKPQWYSGSGYGSYGGYGYPGYYGGYSGYSNPGSYSNWGYGGGSPYNSYGYGYY